MEYCMPAYKRNGVLEVAFASQKQYISLYEMNEDVVDEYHAALADLDIGKGCIRFRCPEKIDFGLCGATPLPDRFLQIISASTSSPEATQCCAQRLGVVKTWAARQ